MSKELAYALRRIAQGLTIMGGRRIVEEAADKFDAAGPDVFKDVAAFYERMGFKRAPKPTPLHALAPGRAHARLKHLHEEFDELNLAVLQEDVVAQADAFADLIYIALGGLWEMGLDSAGVWRAVQAANMRKQPDPTTEKKVKKPANWRGPEADIQRLVEGR